MPDALLTASRPRHPPVFRSPAGVDPDGASALARRVWPQDGASANELGFVTGTSGIQATGDHIPFMPHFSSIGPTPRSDRANAF